MSIVSKIEIRKRELRQVQASLDSMRRWAQEGPDLWSEFLDEKYEGGKKKVPNPNPETKDRSPKVAISTVLSSKDSSASALKAKIRKEFQAWAEKHPSVKARKETAIKDVSAEGKKLNLGSDQLGKLKKIISGDLDPKNLQEETGKLQKENDALHKKHLFLGDDPDKEPHPKAEDMTNLVMSLNKGKGKSSLDAISKSLAPSFGPEGAKAVVDWVKASVQNQAMKDLAAGKDIKAI